jgi:hypothetical protein
MLGRGDNRTGESSQSGGRKVVNVTQPSVAALLDEIEGRQAEIGMAMAAAILREVEPIRAASSHDSGFRPRFDAFCERHVATFIAVTRESREVALKDLAFVREVAERRADDAFPLTALMEGLRVGHRVLNRRINQLGSGWNTPAAAVLWLTTRLVEYMDAAGAELGEGYRARQALSAGRADLARREILDDLLEGRYASRPDAALLAASVGFEPDEPYSVAVLVATDHGAATTQTLATDVARAAFAVTSFRFVVVRGDEVVGIFRAADTQAVIARARYSQARVGVSTTCRGISEVARGYWEAVRAIRFTSEQDPCIDLSRVGPLRYLEFNADSVARQLAAEYLGPLRQGTALADTLLVYVDSGLSARVTAERLGIHLNTVHNRLERVAELLRRPQLGPVDFVEAATAIRICRDGGARGVR